MRHRLLIAALLVSTSAQATPAPAPAPTYDVIVRGGTIYDGTGSTPYRGDVAINSDRIVAVGKVRGTAKRIVDARRLAVAPGFINMLSWANESLIADGRGMSDTKQGVTLEVMGEGWSMGPLSPAMKANEAKRQGDIKYPIGWTTLREYQDWLTARGITPNIASFVGALTVRENELGEDDVDPTPQQLKQMQALVRSAMNEGALGVGSSLIYAPDNFAETPELLALMKAAAPCGGMYISHIRDEGPKLLEAIDELIEIAEKSGARAEIYHFKQAGRRNWDKIDAAIARVDAARARGLKITANMYTYPASSTGFDAAMPLWIQAGGIERWVERLRQPELRARALAEMRTTMASENSALVVNEPDKVTLLAFKTPGLRPLVGKTLGEIARERGQPPEEVMADLIVADGTRVQVAYVSMREENVAREVALPWMSFGSDAASQAPEGVFLLSSTHPRAYGNFARVLGKYARDEKRLTLADAVRRLSGLPAANLGIARRGTLKVGNYADLAIFDPATVGDTATFARPQQYAIGVRHVFVNGVQVLKDGEHTGAKPGRVVAGPGTGKCVPVEG
jgi:N-acyl-D-amino-acid deacylase